MTPYEAFIESKRLSAAPSGGTPVFRPDFLKGFQAHLTDWVTGLGRAAVFADCGLGKGPMAMVCCEDAVRQLDKPALIIAPLAVSRQFVREADKFGLEVHHTQDGTLRRGVNVTNYERLKNFRNDGLGKVALDESGILKNFDGKYRRDITDFMACVPRLSLWSATPAPNDYMEFGSSCEALGVMGRNQMLGTFFTNGGEDTQQWRLKGHARTQFWRWMATWARAVRRPSDLGFDDAGYGLPPLEVIKHVLPSDVVPGARRGMAAPVAATLSAQRDEDARTVARRCRLAADLVPKDRQCVIWCHRNDESSLLKSLLPRAVEVTGSDSDARKESALIGFADGSIETLITKPRIAGFGLNWQGCHDVIYFPSHSHEAYYQAIRRCWRFGQQHGVTCHLVTTRANAHVTDNMLRKERQCDAMYRGIVREMGNALAGKRSAADRPMELPRWMR